jgi:hypothetical protein
MGTPLPPIDIDPGVLCPVCWGEDKPFGLVTPIRLFLALHDWSEGTLFNELHREELETPQELAQNPSVPCLWFFLGPLFTWIVEYTTIATAFLVLPVGGAGVNAFFKIEEERCKEILPNGVTDPFDNIIYDGTGSVYFGRST